MAVATSFLLKKKSKKKKIFDFILNFQKKNLTKLASLTNCHIFVGQNDRIMKDLLLKLLIEIITEVLSDLLDDLKINGSQKIKEISKKIE